MRTPSARTYVGVASTNENLQSCIYCGPHSGATSWVGLGVSLASLQLTIKNFLRLGEGNQRYQRSRVPPSSTQGYLRLGERNPGYLDLTTSVCPRASPGTSSHHAASVCVTHGLGTSLCVTPGLSVSPSASERPPCVLGTSSCVTSTSSVRPRA